MNRRWKYWLPWLAIIMIGFAYAYLSFHMPLTGDDLYFSHLGNRKFIYWQDFQWTMHAHFEGINGRLSDMLMLFWLAVLPTWGIAMLNAVGVAGMFAAGLYAWKGTKDPTLSMIFISLLAFTLPWYAVWMEFCTLGNCAWASGCGLTAIIILTRGKSSDRSSWLWLALPFCLCATWMHESMGLGLACGIIAYLLLSDFRKKASLAKWAIAVSIILGGLMVFATPIAYSRASSQLTSLREPTWKLIFVDSFYVIILLAASIGYFIKKPSQFLKLIRSEWIIYFTASGVCTCIMLMAGYGGRPGWFGQLFALISLFQMWESNGGLVKWKWGSSLSIIMLALLSFHYVEVCKWQKKMSADTEDVISQLKRSSDGIIYSNYLMDSDVPWYVLRKTHGVPDEDDTWYRHCMSDNYFTGGVFVILPTAIQDIDLPNFHGEKNIGRHILRDKPLPGAKPYADLTEYPVRSANHNNRRYIESTFTIDGRKFYLYSPVDNDPGNYWLTR